MEMRRGSVQTLDMSFSNARPRNVILNERPWGNLFPCLESASNRRRNRQTTCMHAG